MVEKEAVRGFFLVPRAIDICRARNLPGGRSQKHFAVHSVSTFNSSESKPDRFFFFLALLEILATWGILREVFIV